MFNYAFVHQRLELEYPQDKYKTSNDCQALVMSIGWPVYWPMHWINNLTIYVTKPNQSIAEINT